MRSMDRLTIGGTGTLTFANVDGRLPRPSEYLLTRCHHPISTPAGNLANPLLALDSLHRRSRLLPRSRIDRHGVAPNAAPTTICASRMVPELEVRLRQERRDSSLPRTDPFNNAFPARIDPFHSPRRPPHSITLPPPPSLHPTEIRFDQALGRGGQGCGGRRVELNGSRCAGTALL